MPRSKSKSDWIANLDFERALATVESEFYGDWFRDPWGWPELRWMVKRGRHHLEDGARRTGVGSFAPIDVAKENFGTRPAIVMDPIDRLVYQALVDEISLGAIGDLRPTAFGWRLKRDDPKKGVYSPNATEHEGFRNHIQTYGGFWGASGLKTDIVSFFANINIERLVDLVITSSRNTAPVKRLANMLHSWDASPARNGLPQRSTASAVLANLYLKPLDDLLLASDATLQKKAKPKGKQPTIGRLLRDMFRRLNAGSASRWMDDIWVFGRDPGKLREHQIEIQIVLRELGLDMNIAKTDVLEGAELHSEVLELEYSAVEGAMLGDPKDFQPLDGLVEKLVGNPEHSTRSAFKFALRRMRDHAHYSQVDSLIGIAERAPHAADALARVFRDSGRYRDLYSWYLRYRRGAWSALDWSAAQFGTMFPSNRVRKGLAEHFAEVVATPGGSLAMTSLAAERLAAKDPDQYRSAIRASLRASPTPLERRTLALAALACGEERTYLRLALKDHRENAPLLEFLEDRAFKPLRSTPDFSGE
jgi:hypothetical protein